MTIFIMIVVAAITILSIRAIDRVGTTKRLRAHQSEWDNQKKVLRDSGASEYDIAVSYVNYMNSLEANRHWFFGACYPRL